MRALPSIYTKIYLIFFLALHAEYRVRVLRTVDFNLAKVIQDFFSKFWKYEIVLKYIGKYYSYFLHSLAVMEWSLSSCCVM